jgi:3-oxoacyl-[acyl-carrier-protein] synthase-3
LLISEISGYVGELEINLAERFPNQLLFEKTGISSVYETTLTTKEIAKRAVLSLPTLSALDEVNLLLLITQSPDDFLPANAIPLASSLGLKKELLAIDLNQGCSGFVQALCICDKLIEHYGTILLVTADRYRNKLKQNDRSTNAVFSDGACAILLKSDKNFKLIYEDHITDGSKRDWLFQSTLAENDGFLYMSGPEVWMFTRSTVVPQIKKALEEASSQNLEVRRIYIHQASKLVVDGIKKLLGVEGLVAQNYSRRGNTVSSSIPFLLIDEPFELEKKECVIFAGFGVGLTSTVAILARN